MPSAFPTIRFFTPLRITLLRFTPPRITLHASRNSVIFAPNFSPSQFSTNRRGSQNGSVFAVTSPGTIAHAASKPASRTNARVMRLPFPRRNGTKAGAYGFLSSQDGIIVQRCFTCQHFAKLVYPSQQVHKEKGFVTIACQFSRSAVVVPRFPKRAPTCPPLPCG